MFIVLFLFGCASNPFRVTGGYISKEESAARRLEEHNRRAAQEAADAKLLADIEERRKRDEAALVDAIVKAKEQHATSIDRWKLAYLAHVEQMVTSKETPDDICDAAIARTLDEKQAAGRAFSASVALETGGRRGGADDVRAHAAAIEKEFRLIGKSRIIEMRMNAESAK
jgi:hypothetical protein